MPYIQKLQLKRMVFAAPDQGAIANTRTYAQYFKVDLVVCHKKRAKPNEVATIQVSGSVKNAHVILIDDMVDTGHTICQAAKQLKEKGAYAILAFCTHALLSGDAYDRVSDSVLEELVVQIPFLYNKHAAK